MHAKKSLSFIKRFRLIGQMEGISFLVLLGIAMPMKYLFEIPEAVKLVGWAHGLLFMLYLVVVAQAKLRLSWPWKQVFFAGIASVVPFGPFIFDWHYLKTVPGEASSVKVAPSHGNRKTPRGSL